MTTVDDRQLWPNGKIFYELSQEAKKDLEPKIRSAMEHIEERTHPLIRFIERKDQYDNAPNYIYIVRGDGCHSPVGMHGGMQMLSLGPGCEDIRTLIHELLHAVGLHHEHQRSDRDDYIEIHFNNIEPARCRNFQRRGKSTTDVLRFDYESIMLYDPEVFGKNGPSMIFKFPEKIRRKADKTGMSDLDVQKVSILYQ